MHLIETEERFRIPKTVWITTIVTAVLFVASPLAAEASWMPIEDWGTSFHQIFIAVIGCLVILSAPGSGEVTESEFIQRVGRMTRTIILRQEIEPEPFRGEWLLRNLMAGSFFGAIAGAFIVYLPL